MKNNLSKIIDQKTISLDEAFKNFSPQQNKVVEDEMRYYDVLLHLKETRQQLGLTQAEVAERASLPRTTVTKVESGQYNPTLNTLLSIASALNKTLQIRVV